MTFFRSLSDRTRIVAVNAVSAGFIKACALLVAIATMPAYLTFFDGAEALAAWLVLISVLNWVFTVDLGIGNGMRNTVVNFVEADDWIGVRRAVAGAYGAAIGIALVLSGIILTGVGLAHYSSLGFQFDYFEHLSGGLVVWVLAAVLLQFVLRTITFVQYAAQRAAVVNAVGLASSSLILGYLLLANQTGLGRSQVDLGAAFFLAMNVPLAAITIWTLRGYLSDCGKWRLKEFLAEAPAALRSGRGFFANQVLFTVLVTTSPVLVSAFGVPEGVISYTAHYTLYSIIPMVGMIALTPMWSAVTQAKARGDIAWIRRSFKTMVRLSIPVFGLVVAGVLLTPAVLELWLGPGTVPSGLFIASAFGVYSTGLLMHSMAATVVSGLSSLSFQRRFYAAGVVVKAVLVAGAVVSSDYWLVVPLIDGLIFWAYFFAERRRIDAMLDVRSAA